MRAVVKIFEIYNFEPVGPVDVDTGLAISFVFMSFCVCAIFEE